MRRPWEAYPVSAPEASAGGIQIAGTRPGRVPNAAIFRLSLPHPPSLCLTEQRPRHRSDDDICSQREFTFFRFFPGKTKMIIQTTDERLLVCNNVCK